MYNLLIIGARGYGREFYNSYTQHPTPNTVIKGFLDDDATVLDGFGSYPSILGSVEDYQIAPNDLFYCALGDNKARSKYIKIIKDKGGYFPAMIHPTAIVHPTAIIGEGVTVGQFCTISSDVNIGQFSMIFGYSNLGHDTIIGENCSLGTYTFTGGFCHIEDGATLHTRSTILPHKKVGADAIVGAGSVVIKNVKPKTSVFGNPATVIF